MWNSYLSIFPSCAEINNSCIFLVILSVFRTTSSWVGIVRKWSPGSLSDPRPSLDAARLPPDFVPLQKITPQNESSHVITFFGRWS